MMQLNNTNLMVCLNFEITKNLFFVILDLFQLNRVTYNRVHHWFDHLDEDRKTLLNRQLESYPLCDDLTEGSSNNFH